jgi:hypothetical protein
MNVGPQERRRCLPEGMYWLLAVAAGTSTGSASGGLVRPMAAQEAHVYRVL